MAEVIHMERRSAVLTPSSLACLSHVPTVNLTAGCAHECRYCYARGYAISNVIRLYNLYDGTKFFYGGIGNNVDIYGPFGLERMIDGGTARYLWKTILDRAEEDIKMVAKSLGATNIHIFGFSRGAAQSIELADRLAKLGITVDFLGLFDPVYSLGDPGMSSDLITPTHKGTMGNYVERELPTNVQKAMVIYAMNETRTWFPATKLVDASGEEPNNVTSVGSPGVHSDIGGHFGNNQKIQALCLTTMIEGAVSRGNAQFFPDKPLDEQLEAAYNSTYTAMMAVFDAGDRTNEYYDQWSDAQDYWKPLSPDQYRAMANSWNFSDWRPGPVGAQNGEEFYNAAMVRNLNLAKYYQYYVVSLLSFSKEQANYYKREYYVEKVFQTSEDWIVRDLDWVEKGLWDTYDGVSPGFMQYLYGLLAHPKGGWRATLDRGAEQFETPMQS